ncbi:hypothetical protein J5X07_00990 [Actinomyces bowdenii]|uniref:hypothetical protein n=1 Tax=Actinomyces bowdenii TaxID=131109 RepID=UPI001ABC194A|nr:hypothetical protein [Actinomyces bowdenii]MBO3723619.1 hypothetical protein [Actinomyces bowdenii]
MSEQGSTPDQALDSFADHCARWLRSSGAQELVVEIDALGRRSHCTHRALRRSGLLRRLRWVEGGVPREIVDRAIELRRAMARPGSGAWTTAFLSMSTRDYEMISDFAYDRRPYLLPPCTGEDCAEERRLFPREEASTPEWMEALVRDHRRREDRDGPRRGDEGGAHEGLGPRTVLRALKPLGRALGARVAAPQEAVPQ